MISGLKAELAEGNTTGLLTPSSSWTARRTARGYTCAWTDGEEFALLMRTLTAAPSALSAIHPWSHETPVLYHALLTLYDADGAVQEALPYDTLPPL